MPEASLEIREGFNRSRRNLLLIGLLLVFSQFAGGLTLKELNVFGNKTELGNPIQIELVLWVGFFYLFWRYYQYFHYSNYKGNAVIEFFSRRGSLAKKILKKVPEYKDWLEEYAKSSEDAQKIKNPRRDIKIEEISILEQKYFFSRVKLEQLSFELDDGNLRTHNIGSVFKIPANNLIIPNFASLLYVIFRIPLFTEYYFPFVIATFPVIKHFW